MNTFKRLLTYIIIVTALLANMDWKPIHQAWWNQWEWPAYAGSFERWSKVRMWTAMFVCPPCAPLAENYYYVLMEIEAGEEEQLGVLPVGHNHFFLNPHGDWMYRWGQGYGRPWRRVSMLSYHLYWLPYSLVWWIVVGDLFRGKRPWWIPKITH